MTTENISGYHTILTSFVTNSATRSETRYVTESGARSVAEPEARSDFPDSPPDLVSNLANQI